MAHDESNGRRWSRVAGVDTSLECQELKAASPQPVGGVFRDLVRIFWVQHCRQQFHAFDHPRPATGEASVGVDGVDAAEP